MSTCDYQMRRNAMSSGPTGSVCRRWDGFNQRRYACKWCADPWPTDCAMIADLTYTYAYACTNVPVSRSPSAIEHPSKTELVEVERRNSICPNAATRRSRQWREWSNTLSRMSWPDGVPCAMFAK